MLLLALGLLVILLLMALFAWGAVTVKNANHARACPSCGRKAGGALPL